MYSAGTFFAHTDYETLPGGRIKMRPPCRQLHTLWQHTSPIFLSIKQLLIIFPFHTITIYTFSRFSKLPFYTFSRFSMLQIYTFSRKSKDFFCISLSFNLLKHHKDPIPTLSFLRYYQHMALIAQSGGKNIGFATILQLQSLAQFCHGKWEIAGGDVRLGDS